MNRLSEVGGPDAAPPPAAPPSAPARSPIPTPRAPSSGSATVKFRRQHGELLEHARGLVLPLDREALAYDAMPARRQLARLAGLLRVHLAMEDDVMYPRLGRHGDGSVRQLARRFESEIGFLGRDFAAYLARWETNAAVEAAPDAFIAETMPIVDALADRIEREDDELYQLVDRIGLEDDG